jgi:hypothetical protein
VTLDPAVLARIDTALASGASARRP